MTTFATRSPLQPLLNPYMMSDLRKSERRTSDRLREKEDAQLPNGVRHDSERLKSRQSTGTGAKQTKVNGNDPGNSTTRGRGKRKIDHDEESDGFMFTRTRSKKAKATAISKEPEAIPEVVEEPKPPKSAALKKTRKKTVEPESKGPVESEAKPENRRRSARNSGESITAEPAPVQVKKRRTKHKNPSTPASEAPAKPEQEPPQERSEVEAASEKPADALAIQNEEATKIALPFADTPIQRRNKEMRANSGQRRSSLGNRGRRASSLIDSGKSNAMPHDDVEPTEFYKHIESGLPEPRRMRQLLTWCGTRALIEKPSFSSEDSNAKLAAREIQQQLLKDFTAKSEMSDWFSRRESTPPPQAPKPNPKNLTNLSQIADLEQKIARLQVERQTWEALLQPPSQPLLIPTPSEPPEPHTLSQDLLSSPSQLAALTTLQSFHRSPTEPQSSEPQTSSSTLHASAASRIQNIATNLEFEVDQFAGNVHALEQYKNAAGRVADDLLGISAQALEDRERIGEEKERENAGLEEGEGEVGSRDVLRALSRVIDR